MRAFTPVHRWIYHMSRGRIGTTWTTAGMPVLLLTTTGRRTGTARTRPVGYIPDDDRLIIIASNAGSPKHPVWYLNLCKHPHVIIELYGGRKRMRAVVAEGADRDRLWSITTTRYPTFSDFQAGTDRQIPVVVLSPEDSLRDV